MGSMKKLAFGAALAVGAMAFTAVPAEAAHIGIYFGVGAPGAYMPPCPGPGYAWVNGYWAAGAWIPGYWNFVGAGYGPVAGGYYGFRGHNGWYGDRDDFRGRGDWGGDRDRGDDHGRGDDRGGWGRGGDRFRR